MNNSVLLFLDELETPIAKLNTPVQFDFDSRKLPDGRHTLKVVSKSIKGKEGVSIIEFEVRNGPSITVEGISSNSIIDGVVPLMINSYDKGDQNNFIIQGSETPKTVPNWFWVVLFSFLAWAAFYLIRYYSVE